MSSRDDENTMVSARVANSQSSTMLVGPRSTDNYYETRAATRPVPVFRVCSGAVACVRPEGRLITRSTGGGDDVGPVTVVRVAQQTNNFDDQEFTTIERWDSLEIILRIHLNYIRLNISFPLGTLGTCLGPHGRRDPFSSYQITNQLPINKFILKKSKDYYKPQYLLFMFIS